MADTLRMKVTIVVDVATHDSPARVKSALKILLGEPLVDLLSETAKRPGAIDRVLDFSMKVKQLDE